MSGQKVVDALEAAGCPWDALRLAEHLAKVGGPASFRGGPGHASAARLSGWLISARGYTSLVVDLQLRRDGSLLVIPCKMLAGDVETPGTIIATRLFDGGPK